MTFETIEQLQEKKEKMKENRPLTKDERKLKIMIQERKHFRCLINECIKIPEDKNSVCSCCKRWIEEIEELKRKIGGEDEQEED